MNVERHLLKETFIHMFNSFFKRMGITLVCARVYHLIGGFLSPVLRLLSGGPRT